MVVNLESRLIRQRSLSFSGAIEVFAVPALGLGVLRSTATKENIARLLYCRSSVGHEPVISSCGFHLWLRLVDTTSEYVSVNMRTVNTWAFLLREYSRGGEGVCDEAKEESDRGKES